MVEKIGSIKNPLTIIAIFAGIAEISGTAVLPFISDHNQGTYIWFLIVFPILLIVFFFLTLNFNHRVLYAPSDFRNEDNFFKSLQSASPQEKADKLNAEVREIESEPAPDVTAEAVPQVPAGSAPLHRASPRDITARYLLAEELVLNKLAKELKREIRRDMRFVTPGRTFVFDGMVVSDEKVIAIEVKYFRDARSVAPRFRKVFRSILDAGERLPDSMRDRFSLILAVATDAPTEDHQELAKRLTSLIGVTPFPVDIRVFSLEELEKEFNLG